MSSGHERHTVAVLTAGAAIGLTLAIAGLMTRASQSELPEDAAARVNATIIGNEEYARALQRFGSDSREAISDADAAWVLNRLIDEELLIQRAIEIGLAETSPSVRSALVQTVLDSILAESAASRVTRDELRAWFQENHALFAGQPLYRVRAYRFAARSEAEAALPDETAARRAGAGLVDIPDTLLPLSKLRDYLGSAAVAGLAGLDTGESSVAYPFNDGWLRLYVVEHEPGSAADFETDYAVIEQEWRRRNADETIRRYLERLRNEARIVVRPASGP